MKKKKRGHLISNIVLVVAVGFFLFSGYKLFTIFHEYNEGEREYESIQEEVVVIETVVNEETGEDEAVFQVDFERLQSMNPDIVAWIRFDQPDKINYPIVKGEDNDKYLSTTVEGKRNSSGAIFMDANNSGDFSDRNTFIYGHNMKNGSMFGQLRKYKKAEFCKENPYFYIYTPDGKEIKYQVFSVCIVEDTSESYTKEYSDEYEFLKYIEQIRKIALYSVDVELTAESQIVSLSTCTNVTETQRLLVHGVKISETMIGE